MINSIIEAISISLNEEFGDGYETHMEEIHIGIHYQACTHRVKQLADSGKNIDSPYDECKQAPCTKGKILHTRLVLSCNFSRASSTTALIFLNIASGGSIIPYSSEQSILMNLGSASHCLRYISRTLFWNVMSAS